MDEVGKEEVGFEIVEADSSGPGEIQGDREEGSLIDVGEFGEDNWLEGRGQGHEKVHQQDQGMGFQF